MAAKTRFKGLNAPLNHVAANAAREFDPSPPIDLGRFSLETKETHETSGAKLFEELLSQKKTMKSGPLIMGICNVTPDSFSDGGLYHHLDTAKRRIDELISEGADIIDIGGESTRPGAPPVGVGEQLSRVFEVACYAVKAVKAIRSLTENTDVSYRFSENEANKPDLKSGVRIVLVSIDTTRSQVAKECLRAGVHMVNDVSMLLEDRMLASVVADHRAGLVLSHARGTQRERKSYLSTPRPYQNVIEEVASEWTIAAKMAVKLGVLPSALIFDPGLGFDKSAADSFALVAELDRLLALLEASPVVPKTCLVGTSRKSFLTLVAEADPKKRFGASIAAAIAAWKNGANIVRTHDVRDTKQAFDFFRLFDRFKTDGQNPLEVHEKASQVLTHKKGRPSRA